MKPTISPYWQKTRRLTVWLLLLWFLLTFVVSWFARELNEIVFAGFPLGFYFAAQGILLCYLLIVIHYSRRMQVLDDEHRKEAQ